MENIDDYSNYWETRRFLQSEELELDSCWIDETLSGYYDSSSPDGVSAASKNIVSERNRRQKLNQRLFALRAVVPNISKMDKASIVKDAIDYIQKLHEEQRRIQEEIKELESKCPTDHDFDHDLPAVLRSKKKKTDLLQCAGGSSSFPIEVLEMRIANMGEKTIVVSMTCSKRADTMVKLCEVFESLGLNTITSNITTFSGKLLKTVFIEAEEEEKDHIRMRIENAIAVTNYSLSPASTC